MAKSLPPSLPTTPLDTADSYPHHHRQSQQSYGRLAIFSNLDINHAMMEQGS